MYVYPEKKLRGLSPYIYIHVSVSDLYIPHNFLRSRIGRPIIRILYINRSPKHWERGRAVSFLGIGVSIFQYIVFAVYNRW